MIIIQLAGGLANQLFQYAFGRALALKNSDQLKLDTTGYTPSNFRQYKLDAYNIKAEIATAEEIKKLKLPYGLLSRFFRGFKYTILGVQNIDYDPKLLEKKGNQYLTGFFQSEEYFKKIRDVILNDLNLNKPLSEKAKQYLTQIKQTTTASLHVRRTDYVTNIKANEHHGTCSLEYYEKAIKLLSDKFSNITFFIFSDDINWCKENLKINFPVVYVEDLNEHEDLYLMSQCQHNIIANSSFSWWGAWLNNNADKVIIAPEKWANVKNIHKDIVPKDWIKI